MTALNIINNSISQTINENVIHNLQNIGISHKEAIYLVTEYCDLDALAAPMENISEIF
jgi:hypothetical protein